MKNDNIGEVLHNEPFFIVCKFKDEYNRNKMLSLYNETEKTHIKKGKISEGARCTKCKWFVANYYINKNERKKYTLFDLTYLLKTYINYCTYGPLTYSFCIYYKYYTNLIKV